jgi:hypothetical protein
MCKKEKEMNKMKTFYIKGFHDGYVCRTKNVLTILDRIEIQERMMKNNKYTEANLKKVFRRLRKVIRDSGIVPIKGIQNQNKRAHYAEEKK